MSGAALACPRDDPAPSRPKILSLSTEFPNPSEPGKGLFVRARLLAMSQAADMTVVAPVPLIDYANPRKDLLASLRVPATRMEGESIVHHPRWLYPPFGGSLNPFLLYARLLWPVSRLHLQRRLDLIDAHYAFPEGVAAALLSQALGIPFMVTLRGLELRRRHRRGMRRWMGWAVRRAVRVIAVSDELRRLAIDLGAPSDRVVTIPNGVNRDVFFPRDKALCRAAHDIARTDPVILCAGDLAEVKGHHRVISAVKVLAQTHPRLRLVVAGGVGRSGRYAETLRQQVVRHGIADRVRFCGELPQERLAELMSAADVFCLASSREGWPNVVNEALASGTPVVATDVGAVRRLIPSASYGSIVPVNDTVALCAALDGALTGSWDHDAIARWGRARTWDRVAEEVLQQAHVAIDASSRTH